VLLTVPCVVIAGGGSVPGGNAPVVAPADVLPDRLEFIFAFDDEGLLYAEGVLDMDVLVGLFEMEELTPAVPV
jgi:hypothetical protein